MRSMFTLPVDRRPFVALIITAALVAGSASAVYARAPAASQEGQQQQQAQQAAPGRTFGSDAGMMFNPVKPANAADFEMVIGRVREALAKSADPVRKQQAASWKVFKAQEPGPNGSVLYIFLMDPAVKGADYTISKILSEAFPAEVQALYQKFSDAYAGGQTLVNLTLVSSFGGSGMVYVPLPAGQPSAQK